MTYLLSLAGPLAASPDGPPSYAAFMPFLLVAALAFWLGLTVRGWRERRYPEPSSRLIPHRGPVAGALTRGGRSWAEAEAAGEPVTRRETQERRVSVAREENAPWPPPRRSRSG
ncbi:hypothetical protein [Actinomadura atramentaria]|uniref:hypothetical protein n=1 Tax=Actinomadura atramentaria TaxID=1990 RepID=UPI0012FA161F|nr:hypothetical protein [Actinomadura atramentaria]